MKIYLGQHSIDNVDKVDTGEEIALGYIDSEFLAEKISVSIENDFTTSSKLEILPYDITDSLELALYDKDDNLIDIDEHDNIFVRQNDGKYCYIPKGSVSFKPYTFNYKVLAKKTMKYMSSRKYNLNVACSNKELADRMIQFFSDSNERNLCPSNITFNNGDLKIKSLLDTTLENNDFMFFEEFEFEGDEDNLNEIINQCIENNIVPWIIKPGIQQDENSGDEIKEKTFTIKNSTVTNCEPFMTKEYFEIGPTEPGTEIHNIFSYEDKHSPLIIKELTNKGFIVYCTDEFMARLGETYNIFYEALMYVYLKTYISTKTISEWIADVMPNYIVQNGKLTQKDKFTSHMELHKLLGLRENDVIPIEVNIEPPEGSATPIVYYTGMSSNYLIFKKISTNEYADPKKESHQISIFTSRKDIVFYDSFIYSIQESIKDKISCSVDGSTVRVKVEPFKNTFLNIRDYTFPMLETNIDASLSKQFLYLVWNNKLGYKKLELTSNPNSEELVLLATIEIIKAKESSKLYDMRLRGGGLPEDYADNFDCLDIGNINGRPYRKGGTLITTIDIPLKYKDMEQKIYDIVYNSIRKNMVADDYLVLNLNFE